MLTTKCSSADWVNEEQSLTQSLTQGHCIPSQSPQLLVLPPTRSSQRHVFSCALLILADLEATGGVAQLLHTRRTAALQRRVGHRFEKSLQSEPVRNRGSRRPIFSQTSFTGGFITLQSKLDTLPWPCFGPRPDPIIVREIEKGRARSIQPDSTSTYLQVTSGYVY